MSRLALKKGVRFKVLKRDGFKCQFCGAHGGNVNFHIDHLIPVCNGGDNSMLNLATTCEACNAGKGESMPTHAMIAHVFNLRDLDLGMYCLTRPLSYFFGRKGNICETRLISAYFNYELGYFSEIIDDGHPLDDDDMNDELEETRDPSVNYYRNKWSNYAMTASEIVKFKKSGDIILSKNFLSHGAHSICSI